MDKDYKKVLKEKKIEAERIMTPTQVKSCHKIIHTAALASFGGGVIPIPVADAIPITAAQLTMVGALGNVFGVKISEAAAKALIGTAAATMFGRSIMKAIPVVGWGISGMVAAGVTEAIGWSIAVDFARQSSKPVPNTISPDIEVPSVTDNNIEKQDLETRAASFLAGTKTRAVNKKEYDELIEDFEKVLDQIPEDDPLRNIYDKLCLLF